MRTTLLCYTARLIADNPTELVDKVLKEEKKLHNVHGTVYPEHVRARWARNRIKQLLDIKKAKKICYDNSFLRKVKGIDQTYWEWIVLVMDKTDRTFFDTSIFDYFKGKEIKTSTRMTYAQAKIRSDTWHKKKFHDQKAKEYSTAEGEQIRDMVMVQLTSKDLKAEGSKMQNCIGGFTRCNSTNQLYSLRDQGNEPHVSIEVSKDRHNYNKWEITEVRGKQNAIPVPKYIPYVIDWISTKNFAVNSAIVRELLVSISDNNYYSGNAGHCTYNEISQKRLEALIDKMTIFSNNFNPSLCVAARFNYISTVERILNLPRGGPAAAGNYFIQIKSAIDVAIKYKHKELTKMLLVASNGIYFYALSSIKGNGWDDLLELARVINVNMVDVVKAHFDKHYSLVKAALPSLATKEKGEFYSAIGNVRKLKKIIDDDVDTQIKAMKKPSSNTRHRLTEGWAGSYYCFKLAIQYNRKKIVEYLLSLNKRRSVNELVEHAISQRKFATFKMLLEHQKKNGKGLRPRYLISAVNAGKQSNKILVSLIEFYASRLSSVSAKGRVDQETFDSAVNAAIRTDNKFAFDLLFPYCDPDNVLHNYSGQKIGEWTKRNLWYLETLIKAVKEKK